MKINSMQGNQPLQQMQRIAAVQGSASEEANESTSEKAAELQKKAANSTGIGINFDIKA